METQPGTDAGAVRCFEPSRQLTGQDKESEKNTRPSFLFFIFNMLIIPIITFVL